MYVCSMDTYTDIRIQAININTGESKVISADELNNMRRDENRRKRIERASLFTKDNRKEGQDRAFFRKEYEGAIFKTLSLPRPEQLAYGVLRAYMRKSNPYVCISPDNLANLINHHFGTSYKNTHGSNLLKSLCDKGFIARMDRDIYFFNPDIYYNGDRRLVKKWLRKYNLFNNPKFKEPEYGAIKDLDAFKKYIDYDKEKIYEYQVEYLVKKSKKLGKKLDIH